MGLADTAELAVRINLSGNASAGIDKLTRKVNGLGGSVARAGRGVGQIGAGFARAGLVVGGAAVAGLGAAAKAAIDFEDAFAGVRKTVDEADLAKAGLSFESLARSFRDMATEVPIAATEFARLGETAGALGVKAGDIDDFVRVTALLGVTTDLTADAAADSLGRIGTILKFTGKDYEDFADSLVALGNAGASTESEIIEISKRFAAEGKAAGLATTEIAGLASATASLGFAPERGGTALARVFANMGTNIALANKKGKAFASITGKSIIDLQKSLDSGDGMTIFLDVLKGIKGLSPTEANRTLKALGITNTSDRTIFRAMADNLPFVTDQLGIAAEATGALSEEATKRFDTIRSKIQLLKNNLIEAGITIGEGFAPAIGRAAVKLSEFLKQDANKSALKSLGEDIGQAIDGIDWGKVLEGARQFVGVMESAVALVLDILGAVNKLPGEVKSAAAALLVLNKASGGLIGAGVGNVVGGLAGGAIQGLGSRLPGVGRLFAQPVFVTNFPLGFGAGGGLPGAAAGAAGLGAATIAGGAIITAAAAAAVIAVQQDQSNKNTDLSADIRSGLDSSIVGKSQSELRTALAGVNQGITDLSSNPLYALVQGEALDNLRSMKASLESALNSRGHEGAGFRPDDATTPVVTEIGTLRKNMETSNGIVADRVSETTRETSRGLAIVDTGVSKATAAALETKRETTRGAALTAATTRTGSASVVGAIYANRPIISTTVNVNATTVTKTYTVKERYGPSGGSRNQNSTGSGTFGNGGR